MHRLVLLLAVLLLALPVAGCNRVDSAEQAQAKAIAAFTAEDAHEGPIQDVMVLGVSEATRQGYRGWDVRLSGLVVLPGLPEGMLITQTLFVTADDGSVGIVDQG